MSKEKIEGSPLSRPKLTLGATQTPPPQASNQVEKHKDIKTSGHNNARTLKHQGATMKRTTIYIPDDLAMRLKLYAVRQRKDVSGIITKQIELLLADEG